MTRQQLIELVEHRLVHNQVGMDTVEMYSPQMISKHLELAYNYVLNQILEAKKKFGLPSDLNSYAKTFKGIEIKFDKNREEFYVKLPAKPADIMRNQSIRIVAPNKSLKDAFMSRINGAQNYLMSSLDVNNLEQGKYYLEGEKLFLINLPDGLEKIQVIMIPSFDNYELDDEIILPREGEQLVVETAINMLIQKYNIPADNVNDQTGL